MDLANKHLAAGLICEKMFDPIKTTCDMSLLSADECRFARLGTAQVLPDVGRDVRD